MKPTATGLKWRKRNHGRPDVPYWFAPEAAVELGYYPKSENLSRFAHDETLLKARCIELQTALLLWKSGHTVKGRCDFDGSFKSLFELYQTDPESPLHGHKPGTVRIYTIYLKKLIEDHGDIAIDATDGRQVQKWFRGWRAASGRDQLSVALMKLAVLKAVISFGVLCRKPGCADFQAVLGELEFGSLPGRSYAPTAAQIVAARKAAHAAGAPLRALLYALQFETTARQWDFIGQWLPLSDKKPSAIIDRGQKWVGPMWSWIDQHQILDITPTKTEDTTGVKVAFDLTVCPMVQEELALIPIESRRGPLIINERTGLPYRATALSGPNGWRADFKAAGLPEKMWNRDFRAGGITEGDKSGASRDDRKTVAGHAKEATTEGYERGVSIEAHRRTMLKRVPFRTVGNASET